MLVNLTREEILIMLTWASFYDLPESADIDLMDKFEQVLQEMEEDEDED